jgi:hypothetical protein
MKLDLAERQLLEALLDAEGLSAVLRTLADVCGNKARRALAVHHDEATAQAKYTDGVLELTLPKKAAASTRTLAVQ